MPAAECVRHCPSPADDFAPAVLPGAWKAVERLFGRLNSRERRILVRRYGLDGLSVQTLAQLGRELGVGVSARLVAVLDVPIHALRQRD